MTGRTRYDGPDGPEVALPRGDVTEGVVRIGDTVRRPHRPGSDAVALFLDHLESVGFVGAPRYLGRDAAGRDVLDFLAGDVAGARLPTWAVTEPLLAGVARLNRRLHDAASGWRPGPEVRFPRELDGAPPTPLPPGERELLAHNDLTPQNVVVRGGVPWGAVDFDLAGRTTALTDLATTAMHWVPILDPVDADPAFVDAGVVSVHGIGRRLRCFLDAYGLPPARREAFLAAAALRYDGTWASMRWRAEHLGGGWARMWDEGVGDLIARRAAWFARHRQALAAAVLAPGARGRGVGTGRMDHMADTEDLQQEFVAARERLSIARAALDEFGSTAGQPLDTVPGDDAPVTHPAYDAARAEYEAANAEFVRLEEQLKPQWAQEASQPVE